MSLPNVNVNILNGGLGIQQGSNEDSPLEIGWATMGPTDALLGFEDTSVVVSTYGSGALVDQLALDLAVAGGTAYGCRIFSGTVGSVTHTGTGTGTITVTGSPTGNFGVGGNGSGLLVKITTSSGSSTAGQFAYSLDGGNTYAAAQPIVTSFVIPGSGLTLGFSAITGSGVWVANDSYLYPITIAAGSIGAVTHTTVPGSGGPGNGTVTPSGSPIDAYQVIVTITTAGALGSAAFTYSIDGGLTVSNPITIPSGGTYALGSTGVTLTFANGSAPMFVAGDTYQFVTTQPAFTLTDVTNCMNLMFANPTTWGWVHIIGRPASISAAVSLASAMDTLMSTAAGQGRYAFAIVETPADTTQANIDQALITGFAAFATEWVMICAGDVNTVSPASGTQVARNCAFVASARLASTPVGEDLGRIASGAVVGAVQILRDERQAGGILDAAGFTTLQTQFGLKGAYFAGGRIMAPNTSDFQLIQNRRVMNLACTVSRTALLNFLNSSVRVNTAGQIFEADAQRIERYVTSALNAALVAPGQASEISVQVDRSHNILSDQTLPVSVGVIPLGYAKQINETIGFVNPQLSVQ